MFSIHTFANVNTFFHLAIRYMTFVYVLQIILQISTGVSKVTEGTEFIGVIGVKKIVIVIFEKGQTFLMDTDFLRYIF